MKQTLIFLTALILLSGCDQKDAAFYPQMKNFAYLYEFEALPGKVKNTHQTLFNADGVQVFDVSIDFDAQGCPTHVKSVNKVGEITEVKRVDDALTGIENGQDVVVTLDKNCAMVKKVTPNMSVDIAYNAQGLVEQLSSPQSDVKFHLEYSAAGELNVLRITKADAEVSRATAERNADSKKISDLITTVKTDSLSKTVSNVCKYKDGVPYYCDIITRDGDGNIIDKQYGNIEVSYY